jgi:hypothetical protein
VGELCPEGRSAFRLIREPISNSIHEVHLRASGHPPDARACLLLSGFGVQLSVSLTTPLTAQRVSAHRAFLKTSFPICPLAHNLSPVNAKRSAAPQVPGWYPDAVEPTF